MDKKLGRKKTKIFCYNIYNKSWQYVNTFPIYTNKKGLAIFS